MDAKDNSYKEEYDEYQPSSYKQFLANKFQYMFSEHQNLKHDYAFYLYATKMYVRCIRMQELIGYTKEEIAHLKSLIGMESAERKKTVHSSHSHPVSDYSNSYKRKRIRRTANEIARHYVCEVDKCHKSYGSYGSLNQHMKLKHNDLYNKNMLFLNFGNSA